MRHPAFPGTCLLCLLLIFSCHLPSWSQKFSIPEGYPESLHQQRDDYTAALIEDLDNPQLWKLLSHAYLNMADDLFTDTSEKIEAYDKGLKAATQAMTLHPDDAETHFLYAAELAKNYLRRAIEADGKFTNARIILAKLFIKEGKLEGARAQLLAVIQARNPHYPYAWERRFRPEAQRLLDELQNRK